MSTWVVIPAAGSGTRLAAAGLGTGKQFLPWRGAPLYWAGVRTLARVAGVHGVALAFPPAELAQAGARAEALAAAEDLGLPLRFAPGGARRQDSVAAALAVLPRDCTRVLVHDAARPFASAALVTALLAALDAGARAAIPAVPVKDTVKRVAGGHVAATLPRAELAAVQTPQAFVLADLLAAHAHCARNGLDVTDDASMVEALGLEVAVVPGEESNVKITTPEDLRMLAPRSAAPARVPVTGWGYDVHKYGPGRPMVLGTVPIQGGPEVVAHSDGDVLLHALADALLGCLGRGDIGEHFPDTDPRYEAVPSAVLVNEVLEMALEAGLEVTHADLTLICQVPRLAPWKAQIRTAVAGLLRLPAGRVNVKATTEEGLGFTGEKKGIKAVACVSALLPG
jgi:2-C-methyl-D-erythritol 4-phosphate cytidylyltransferase/2-C-methyl-D-erythritol 2,4-cyclodiphosphate synthase